MGRDEQIRADEQMRLMQGRCDEQMRQPRFNDQIWRADILASKLDELRADAASIFGKHIFGAQIWRADLASRFGEQIMCWRAKLTSSESGEQIWRADVTSRFGGQV